MIADRQFRKRGPATLPHEDHKEVEAHGGRDLGSVAAFKTKEQTRLAGVTALTKAVPIAAKEAALDAYLAECADAVSKVARFRGPRKAGQGPQGRRPARSDAGRGAAHR